MCSIYIFGTLSLGPKALEVYNVFCWENEGDDKKVNKIIEKFQTHCNLRENITWERNAKPTEKSIDQYDTDLRIKASSCKYGELRDSLI